MHFQFKRYFSLTLSVLLLTTKISASGLKEALEEHLKDIAHNDESETVKLEKGKGEKDHHVDTQVKDSHSNQYSKASDDTKYLKKDEESKTSAEKDAYGGYNTKQDQAEDKHTDGFKRGHKKGHHKQGFQNSYHKDESSNKSTYFDDFNDEGDQAGYKSKVNKHDNSGGRSYEGSHNNGQDYRRNNYHAGGSNKYGDVGNKHANHQDYGRKSYLDNAENYNKHRNGHGSYDRGKTHDRQEYRAPPPPPIYHDPGWGWQDWHQRRDWDRPELERGWERDYGGPGYYDDHAIHHDGGYGHGYGIGHGYGTGHGYGSDHGHGYGSGHGHGYGYGESQSHPVAEVPANAPVVAHRKQTITIYEDPRYSNPDKGQFRREEGDSIELNFQPSAKRYASYDDTYYTSVPAKRQRSAESSEINKLVYNYGRQ